jgi:outer membrane lipoprotein-sorting protein
MKNSALVITYLLLANMITAQKNDRKIQNDPKAEAILNKVSKTYKDLKTLESSFTIAMYSKADNINEKYNGKVYMKGEKYKIDTDQMEVICDNIKQYIWLKESNEITINLHEPDEESIETPAQLFTIYQKNFFYKLIGDEKAGNKTLKKIELIPQKLKESNYRKIILLIDESVNQILKAIIESKDGITYTWEIKSFKANVPIDDAFFVFDKTKYPNARIEDLTK